MRFLEKIRLFFMGRCGIDRLNVGLLLLCVVIAAVNLIIRSSVVYLLQLAVLFYAVFRALSKNIYARSKENNWYLNHIGDVPAKIKKRADELKDSTHIYKTCPNCKARLRLARRRGSHTARCPKCRMEFKVFSLYS